MSTPIKQNTTDLQAVLAAVNALPDALDTSDATATPSSMLSGVTAYVDGEKITGTIPTKTASNLTASGATVTVPAGYYASQATKSVSTATQATPSISVSSAGLITASATQSAGYVAAGTKSETKQLTTQGAQTITPGTANKTIASGRYLTGTQTIKGDANLVAGNIKSGVSIFGVAGTMTAGEDVTAETDAYTDLLTDLETAIDALPDAGGSGGVETCSITINYDDGGNGLAALDVTYATRNDDGGIVTESKYINLIVPGYVYGPVSFTIENVLCNTIVFFSYEGLYVSASTSGSVVQVGHSDSYVVFYATDSTGGTVDVKIE